MRFTFPFDVNKQASAVIVELQRSSVIASIEWKCSLAAIIEALSYISARLSFFDTCFRISSDILTLIKAAEEELIIELVFIAPLST